MSSLETRAWLAINSCSLPHTLSTEHVDLICRHVLLLCFALDCFDRFWQCIGLLWGAWAALGCFGKFWAALGCCGLLGLLWAALSCFGRA